MLNLDMKPSAVPTGHIVLHQVLPCFQARTATTAKVSADIPRVTPDFTQTSTL